MGDLGLVAKASRSSQSMMRKPDPLTIAKVFDTFRLIAKVHFLHLFLTESSFDFKCKGMLHFFYVNYC